MRGSEVQEGKEGRRACHLITTPPSNGMAPIRAKRRLRSGGMLPALEPARSCVMHGPPPPQGLAGGVGAWCGGKCGESESHQLSWNAPGNITAGGCTRAVLCVFSCFLGHIMWLILYRD